jgi:hypothetical protein
MQLVEDIKNLIYETNITDVNFGKYNNLLEFAKYEPFIEIKKQIILICKIVGFTNINDIIYLLYNITDYGLDTAFNDKEDQTKITLLNNVFVPLDFEVQDILTETNNVLTKISITKIDTNKYITLFNNECLVELIINSKLLKIRGFIKSDPLNIYMRTSQISNSFLYNKKIRFEEFVNHISTNTSNLILNNSVIDKNFILDIELYNKLQRINKDFADIYLKNMTITEILILNDVQFVNKLLEDYNKFIELNKIQFVKLIKTFTKNANENLFTMFNTIKLLLLGSDENCSVASLLFNLLKDKKNVGNNEYIANIIYEQLNYISQLKLKKSTFNIKNELDKIKGITTADIDLKKQVLLSKNMPDFIKKICL